jgi:hypothetical protein
MAAVAASPAYSACYGAPINTPHSYGTVLWAKGPGRGDAANIMATTANPGPDYIHGDWALQDLWMVLDSSATRWVEQGAIIGRNYADYRWFWAEQHYDSSLGFIFSYHDNHVDMGYPAPVAGTYSQDVITYSAATGNWYTWIGPVGGALTHYGTATNNLTPNSGQILVTGEESCPATSPPTINAYSNVLRWKDTSEVWHNDWTGAQYNPVPPGTQVWLTQYVYLHDWQ